MTQKPLYPEGHPRRIEQDSQRNNLDAPSPSRKKKKKTIGLGIPLVSLRQKNLLETAMMFPSLMLKISLAMNNHLVIIKRIMMRFMQTLNQIQKNHQIMRLRQNQLRILITHNPKTRGMKRETLWIGSMEWKDNHGYKNLCPFHLSQLRRKMMRISSVY